MTQSSVPGNFYPDFRTNLSQNFANFIRGRHTPLRGLSGVLDDVSVSLTIREPTYDIPRGSWFPDPYAVNFWMPTVIRTPDNLDYPVILRSVFKICHMDTYLSEQKMPKLRVFVRSPYQPLSRLPQYVWTCELSLETPKNGFFTYMTWEASWDLKGTPCVIFERYSVIKSCYKCTILFEINSNHPLFFYLDRDKQSVQWHERSRVHGNLPYLSYIWRETLMRVFECKIKVVWKKNGNVCVGRR